MSKKAQQSCVELLVHAPVKTKDVMMALRDWKPTEDVKFTLAKRGGADLLFEVTTASGMEARSLALRKLRDDGLDGLMGLEVLVK